MTITTKPRQKTSPIIDEFISGAPGADIKQKGVKKGNKRQITLTITHELLAKVDELATELGQARAAVINMAIYRAVEHGLMIDGLRKKD
ncbi:MAG: CopG family transcriptional regulator [Candidatus Symbiodolus clandestinus]